MFFRHSARVSLVTCAIFICNSYVADAITMEQMENAAKTFRNACIGKTGADLALVQGMKNGEFPEDENLQCYAKCVMVKLKSLKNGQPQLEPILKQIKLMMPMEMQARTSTVARYCVTLDFNENPCVAAWEFVRCQYTQDPEVFFFP